MNWLKIESVGQGRCQQIFDGTGISSLISLIESNTHRQISIAEPLLCRSTQLFFRQLFKILGKHMMQALDNLYTGDQSFGRKCVTALLEAKTNAEDRYTVAKRIRSNIRELKHIASDAEQQSIFSIAPVPAEYKRPAELVDFIFSGNFATFMGSTKSNLDISTGYREKTHRALHIYDCLALLDLMVAKRIEF